MDPARIATINLEIERNNLGFPQNYYSAGYWTVDLVKIAMTALGMEPAPQKHPNVLFCVARAFPTFHTIKQRRCWFSKSPISRQHKVTVVPL